MRKIPFSPPDITQAEINSVVDTLKSGWLTTGEKTKQFERDIAKYCGTKRAVALNSATAALELTLRLLDIGEGDEVITTPYTYTASASVIAHVGAKIVMIDVKKGSLEMDYEKLKLAVTPRTKAVIPVDIAGIMCDYDKLTAVLNEAKLMFCGNNELGESIGRVAIVADAAHSFGAVRNKIKSGAAADFTCFSFHAVKNLTTGEGGAVTFSPELCIDFNELYKKYMILSLHGQTKDAFSKNLLGQWEYDIVTTGFKCNLTDIASAIGIEQLKRYDGILALRHQIIGEYNKVLQGSNVLPLCHKGDNFSSSGHLYIVRLDNSDIERRNATIERLGELGIATNVHYKPLPMLTAYRNLGFDIANFPNAFDMYHTEITLPLNTCMTIDDANYVATTLLQTIF